MSLDESDTAREVIDWIETELHKDGDEYRDIPEILADARARFCGASSSSDTGADA